jgi:hypothetical protein
MSSLAADAPNLILTELTSQRGSRDTVRTRVGNGAVGEMTRRSNSGSDAKSRVTTNDPIFELFEDSNSSYEH